jgi:integrase
MLRDKRPSTRACYLADLRDFFGADLNAQSIHQFVKGGQEQIAARIAAYSAAMEDRRLSRATRNRRLATLRVLLGAAFEQGEAIDHRALVQGEPARPRKTVRGLSAAQIARLINAPDRETLLGRRDAAILRLLCEHGMRGHELCALNVEDLRPAQSVLIIHRGDRTFQMHISQACLRTILRYLQKAGHARDAAGPLFRNTDHRPQYRGARLTQKGLYYLIGQYGYAVGVELTPRLVRASVVALAAVPAEEHAGARSVSPSGAHVLKHINIELEEINREAHAVLAERQALDTARATGVLAQDIQRVREQSVNLRKRVADLRQRCAAALDNHQVLKSEHGARLEQVRRAIQAAEAEGG